MKQKIINNRQYGLIGDCIKENIENGSKLSITSAYFTLYAFEELKEEFSKVEELRFIFGRPTFIDNSNVKIQDKIRKHEREILGLEEERKYKNDLNQAYIAREMANFIKSKAKIKSVILKPNNGNVYHIENKEKYDAVIMGPFGLSSPGLGDVNSNEFGESNYTDEKKITDIIKNEFDKVWNNEEMLKDVKKDMLNKIKLLYKDNSPEYLYFVTLYRIFEAFLEENEKKDVIQGRTGFKDTVVWNKLYDFQKDGVVGAINKIEKFGGCIIADSVGLGKTFEALAIIKYYELKNNKVLVLTPKKLRENWSVYRQQNDTRNPLSDDRFSYDLLNHTDLSRDGGKSGDIDLDYVNWGNYDLIVIDESHNFRNNQPRKDRETRYTKLMNNIIKAGIKTKVLMLSATPVNNKLDDLKNQISFITEGDDAALKKTAEIKSIKTTLSKAQATFNKWGKLPQEERTSQALIEMLNGDYFKLLDSLTIARSRRHIEKYYNTNEIGEFPKRLEPINIKEGIDTEDEFPELKVINEKILKLNMDVYSPMKYILPTKIDYYEKKYDTIVKGGKSKLRQRNKHSISDEIKLIKKTRKFS